MKNLVIAWKNLSGLLSITRFIEDLKKYYRGSINKFEALCGRPVFLLTRQRVRTGHLQLSQLDIKGNTQTVFKNPWKSFVILSLLAVVLVFPVLIARYVHIVIVFRDPEWITAHTVLHTLSTQMFHTAWGIHSRRHQTCHSLKSIEIHFRQSMFIFQGCLSSW